MQSRDGVIVVGDPCSSDQVPVARTQSSVQGGLGRQSSRRGGMPICAWAFFRLAPRCFRLMAHGLREVVPNREQAARPDRCG